MFWPPSWADTDCVQNIIHKQMLAVYIVRVIASVTALQNPDLLGPGLAELETARKEIVRMYVDK